MPSASSKDLGQKQLYDVWRFIIRRVEDPSNPDYAHYRSLGVTVCDEWHDFGNFCEWALANGYRPGLTLDRMRNANGPYAPWNCRWVSRRDQAYNRTTNHPLRASDGRIRTVMQWSKLTGVPESTIRKRLSLGWSVDESVGLKKREKRNRSARGRTGEGRKRGGLAPALYHQAE